MATNVTAPRLRQQGISLITVLVMLLLATLIVLSSTRLGWLSEKLVGSESDRQRAFAAAEALIRDAERDIKGLQSDNATPCQPGVGFVGCRDFASGAPFFPEDVNDLLLLEERLANTATGCLRGICLPASVAEMGRAAWIDNLAAMTGGTGDTSVAARYGEFTGVNPDAAGNALLRWTRPGVNPAVPPRAWYWVEVFYYDANSDGAGVSGHDLAPDRNSPFVYRITAIVQGLKPGTRVWLRSVYVPRPAAAPV